MTLGIGLLGTGSIATRAFASAIRTVEGASLTAVLSRDQARGAAFAQQFDIPEVYDDLQVLSTVDTHLVDLWRWYLGEPASVGGGVATPADQGPNDEVAAQVFDYPGRLLVELAVVALFCGANRLELRGEAGTIIGDNLFGYGIEGGTITCNGETVAYASTDALVEAVTDFVQAIQPRRAPRATRADGLHHNVRILEAVRNGKVQLAL